MKNLICFTFALFLTLTFVTETSFAQRSPIKITVYGGGTLPIGSFGDGTEASANTGVDIQYSINRNWSVYANGSYNFLSPKSDLVESSHIIEATVGPRYSYNLGGASFIGEAGAGLYNFSSKIGGQTFSSSDFGVNAGAGLEVPVSTQVNFVGKVKFHNVFTEGESTSYMGGYAGFNYRF